jgi:hypothetical protein
LSCANATDVTPDAANRNAAPIIFLKPLLIFVSSGFHRR